MRILDSQGCKVSSCELRRLWSDCADADLSLRWAHIQEVTFSNIAAALYKAISCIVVLYDMLNMFEREVSCLFPIGVFICQFIAFSLYQLISSDYKSSLNAVF